MRKGPFLVVVVVVALLLATSAAARKPENRPRRPSREVWRRWRPRGASKRRNTKRVAATKKNKKRTTAKGKKRRNATKRWRPAGAEPETRGAGVCKMPPSTGNECMKRSYHYCGVKTTLTYNLCRKVFVRFCLKPEPVSSVENCLRERCDSLRGDRSHPAPTIHSVCRKAHAVLCQEQAKSCKPVECVKECKVTPGSKEECRKRSYNYCGSKTTTAYNMCRRVYVKWCSAPEKEKSVESCLHKRCDVLQGDRGHPTALVRSICRNALEALCCGHTCQETTTPVVTTGRTTRDTTTDDTTRRTTRDTTTDDTTRRTTRDTTTDDTTRRTTRDTTTDDTTRTSRETTIETTSSDGTTSGTTTDQTTSDFSSTDSSFIVTTPPSRITQSSSGGVSVGLVVGVVVGAAAAAGIAAVAVGFFASAGGAAAAAPASAAPMASAATSPLYQPLTGGGNNKLYG